MVDIIPADVVAASLISAAGFLMQVCGLRCAQFPCSLDDIVESLVQEAVLHHLHDHMSDAQQNHDEGRRVQGDA